jgi:putative peptide zinc metalloprotease protein
MPTADEPQLALVLVPRTTDDGIPTAATSDEAGGTQPVTAADDTSATDEGATDAPEQPAPSWVFPFDRPPAPGPGDNQALAVNTEDGSVVYDVAFALVWVEDDSVLNTNEAYALASCRDCTTVAVGFQVLLVAGQADVVVPQNLAAAVNYSCVRCLTYALATQLVVTLDGPLSSTGTAALEELWAEIAAFGADIEDVPLAELQARLREYERRILAIIAADRAVTSPPTTEVGSSPGATTGTAGATATATEETGDRAGNATPDEEDTDPGGTGPTAPSQHDTDGTGSTGGSSQATGGSSPTQDPPGPQTGSGPTSEPSPKASSAGPSPSPTSTTPSPTASPSG